MRPNQEEMQTWRVQSPEEPGFHAVITPEKAACKETQIYRLNLPEGESYELKTGTLEMHPVLIQGTAQLSGHETICRNMKRFDAFYLPGNDAITLTALEPCIFYIAAAVYEGYGKAFFRAFEEDAPVGDIHQIHGGNRPAGSVYDTFRQGRGFPSDLRSDLGRRRRLDQLAAASA